MNFIDPRFPSTQIIEIQAPRPNGIQGTLYSSKIEEPVTPFQVVVESPTFLLTPQSRSQTWIVLARSAEGALKIAGHRFPDVHRLRLIEPDSLQESN